MRRADWYLGEAVTRRVFKMWQVVSRLLPFENVVIFVGKQDISVGR